MTPRMRTIDEAYGEILKNDPQTSITKTAFRRFVRTGKIPSVKIGRKTFVNLEAVAMFFSCGIEPSEPTPTTSSAMIPENSEFVLKLVKGA